jgi:hypothetical protein
MATVVTRRSVAQPGEPRGFRRLWRVLRQLFHEVIGAAFAVLALGWFNSALRAWTRDAAHWLIALPVVVGFLFIAFSLTSFRRARQL